MFCVVLSFACCVVFYVVSSCVRFPSFAGEGEYPLEGGCSLFLASQLRQWCFVEGVPSVAFDAKCSPGPANSL